MKVTNLIFLLFVFTWFEEPWISAQTSADPPIVSIGQPGDLPAMIRQAEKGVFFLRVKDAEGRVISSGTGFLVDKKATVATALHVIRPPMRATSASSVEAVSVAGEVCAVTGVIAADESLDLVLLRLERTPQDSQPLVLGADALPERGSKVLVLGHPMEFRFVSSDGIISAVNKTSELPDSFRKSGAVMTAEDVVWLQTSAPVSPGNSGGPMIDTAGKVIGVIQWKSRAGAGMNFALHVPPLRKLLSKKEKLVSITEFGRAEVEMNQIMTQYRNDFQKYYHERQKRNMGNAVVSDAKEKAPLPDHPGVVFIPKLLKIARENPGSDIEIRALAMLILMASGMEEANPDVAAVIEQASSRLIDGYAEDKRTLQLISALSEKFLPQIRDFLQALIKKSNNPDIQAVAAFRLAQRLAVDARTDTEREEVIRLAKAAASAKPEIVMGRDSVAALANELIGKATHAVSGCKAPDLRGEDKAGVSVNLVDLRGRHVVVAFWNGRDFFGSPTNSLDALMKKYTGTPLSVVGVQVGDGGSAFEDSASKLRKWPILKDGENEALKKAWHAQTSPTVFLIDPKGNIAARYEPRSTSSYAFGGTMMYQSSGFDQSNWVRALEKDIDSIPEIGLVQRELRARLMAVPWLSVDWDGTRERTVFLRENGRTSVRWISTWEARPPSGLHLHVEKIGCVDLEVDFSTGVARVTSPVSISSRTMRQRQGAAASTAAESIRQLRESMEVGRWDFFENGMIAVDEPRPMEFRPDGTTSNGSFPAWEVLTESRFRVYSYNGMFWTYDLDEKSKIAYSDMSPPDAGVNDGEIRSPKAIAVTGSTRRQQPDLSGIKVAYTGECKDQTGWQEVRFPSTSGRYVCMQIDSSLNGIRVSALAELELIDGNGDPLPNSGWKCEYANIEPSGNHWPALAWDGKSETFWHTPYVKQALDYPHQLVIDLGKAYTVSGIRIRQRENHPNGRIKALQLFVQEKQFQFKSTMP